MNFYLQRYGFTGPFIAEIPQSDLDLIVVIPCFNETGLIDSLQALYEADHLATNVEVIIVINASEEAEEIIKKQNLQTYNEAKKWGVEHSHNAFKVHLILNNELPKKHAGVGLARKIGMDEAVYRFEQIQKDGIIVCFDADSKCDPNYFTEIKKHFKNNNSSPGCSIRYEHPLEGVEFAPEIYRGIINYELHLRYYNLCLAFVGLPYAFHTVGSSMAVRSSAYQKQGGMNKRKAGEDFYFLHKIIELGGFTHLNTTCVIPSPRISDRVPFGTGKAIGDWIELGKSTYETYNFDSFLLMREFVALCPKLQDNLWEDVLEFSVHPKMEFFVEFLTEQQFTKALEEIRRNSSTPASFIKRFFRWFDAFKVLKLVHFLRDKEVKNEPISIATKRLLAEIHPSEIPFDELSQLNLLRLIEKK